MGDARSDALHVHDHMTVTSQCWAIFYSFLFGGESFDYAYEVGGPNYTEQQARDVAKQTLTLQRARQNFLRDVELEIKH